MPLPETGLEGGSVADHVSHTEQLHQLFNRLTGSPAAVGDVPRRLSVVEVPGSIEYRPANYTYIHNVLSINHGIAGLLTIEVERGTKVVKVNATNHITGVNLSGMTNLGVGYAEVRVIITAGANITLSLGTATVHGSPPATLADGEQTIFDLIDDDPT